MLTDVASTRPTMLLNSGRYPVAMRCLAGCAAVMGLFFSPMALAQSGYYVVPWLSVEEVYDDNIFFNTEDEVSDFITRVSPQLDVGYESETLNWLLSYRNDAEWYKDLSDLDSTTARRFGVGRIEYTPDRRWTFTGDAEYTDSNSVQDLSLNPGGSIPGRVGRAEAQRRLLAGSARYLVSPRLTGGLALGWTNDELIGFSENEVLSAVVDFEQTLNANRSILYGYEYRGYEFDTQTSIDPVIVLNQSENSNTAWVGLKQVLSETSDLELRVGPRISDGDVEPYVLVNWQRSYARGSTILQALWDETFVLGESSRLESKSLLATWNHEFATNFEVSGSVGYADVSGVGYSSDITYFDLSGIYRFTPGIFLTGRYGFNSQEQDSIGIQEGRITHNVVSLAITFTRPRRETARSPS